MRILLDENLDWRLKRSLPGHSVESVARLGWAGLQNGQLLRSAIASGFEALVTMDGNMVYQQDLSAYSISVLVLRARTNRLQDTQPLMASLLRMLAQAPKGKRTIIE